MRLLFKLSAVPGIFLLAPWAFGDVVWPRLSMLCRSGTSVVLELDHGDASIIDLKKSMNLVDWTDLYPVTGESYFELNEPATSAFYRLENPRVWSHSPAFGPAWYGSMKHDSEGYPSISYLDPGNSQVKVSTLGKSGWSTSVVTNSWGTHTSLVIDSQGKLIVAYFAGNELRVARQVSEGWEIEVPFPGVKYVTNTARLAARADGTLALVCHRGMDLIYMERDGDGWSESVIATSNVLGWCWDLECLQDGTPVVSYVLVPPGRGLFVATRSVAGSWSTEEVAADHQLGLYHDLLVNDSDQLSLVFVGGSQVTIRYAVRGESGWVSELVAGPRFAGYSTLAGAIDSTGTPWVAYNDGSHPIVGKRVGGKWHSHTVDWSLVGTSAYSLEFLTNGTAAFSLREAGGVEGDVVRYLRLLMLTEKTTE